MKKPTIIFLSLIIFLSSVYASYWIYSNTIIINVSHYALFLEVSKTDPVKYENITFTSTLLLNGNPVESAIVYLFKNQTEIGSKLTDSNGQCSFEVNVTEAGSFDFKAGYEVVP